MKKRLIIASMLCIAIIASAVKMKPGVTIVRQSDGTTLSIRANGDEDFCYFTTTDGRLICQNGTDFYIAAIDRLGRLTPTTVLAHEINDMTPQERELASRQDRQLFFKSINTIATANRLRREPMAEDATLLPHRGSPRVPVILIEFSDTAFKVPDTHAVFNKYLNADELFDKNVDTDMGSNHGSVRRYFTDMSFGAFTPQFDLYGPYTLSQPLKRYGAGYSSSEDMDALFADACAIADKDIDFSQYDANGDGNVDLVYIIYAGYSQSIAGNSTECIHPKSGTLPTRPTFDGKKIVRYGVNNELNGRPEDQTNGPLINGIGLFCHEFSHCMGLPDMYPSPGSVAERCINQNMDYWDLMDAGEYTYNGYRPTEYTAWERERFGWLKIDTLSTPANVTLSTLARGGKAYRIINDNDPTGHEYYIVENVQKEGWNKSLFGHGLLVSHVDYDDYQFTLGGNKVNSTVGHPRMTIMAADGMFVPEYFIGETIAEGKTDDERKVNSDLFEKYAAQEFTTTMYKAEAAADPFPGTSKASQLTNDSSPATAWTYTGSHMNKPLTEIAEDTDNGTVSFKFMGGASDIKNMELNPPTEKSMIYSIDGRQVGTDRSVLDKGIYIINKKKIAL